MGTVFAVALSITLTAGGAAVAAGAPFGGAAGLGGQYLAGHVLLGVGLGNLASMLVRSALRRIVRQVRTRPASVPAVMVPAPEVQATPAPEVRLATVSVLPARPAAVPPLRGRHAA